MRALRPYSYQVSEYQNSATMSLIHGLCVSRPHSRHGTAAAPVTTPAQHILQSKDACDAQTI